MLTDFMVRATIAGIAVAIVAAPLGCFVVWRRLAYFGDATAHAAMLGIAMALALDIPIFGGTLIAALIMAWAVTQLSGSSLGSDTLLGVFCSCWSGNGSSYCFIFIWCANRSYGISFR